MIVKIQIYRDNGSQPLVSMSGNAFDVISWQAPTNCELIDPPDKALFGFSYVPCYIAPDGMHSLEVVEKITAIEDVNPVRDIEI